MEEKYCSNFGDSLDVDLRGGNSFLVSAVMVLKKQRKELADENRRLKAKLQLLESQNAQFLNLSADRLLREQG